jgi:hypothetical protein
MKLKENMFIKADNTYFGCARIHSVGDDCYYEGTNCFTGNNTTGYSQSYIHHSKASAKPNCSKHPKYKAFKRPTTNCWNCIRAWGLLNGTMGIEKYWPGLLK